MRQRGGGRELFESEREREGERERERAARERARRAGERKRLQGVEVNCVSVGDQAQDEHTAADDVVRFSPYLSCLSPAGCKANDTTQRQPL